LDEIIQIDGVNHPQKLTGPFGGAIHVLQPHTSGTNTTCGSSASKFKESPSGDNVGGVGGWSRTPYLVNLSTNLPSESKSQHMFVMKP